MGHHGHENDRGEPVIDILKLLKKLNSLPEHHNMSIMPVVM